MYVLASRDIELYCDESLLRGLGNGGKARYASMLIDLEEARSAPAPLISHFGRNAVEERIRAIMRYRKASILGIALALLLVAITAVALATSAVTAAPLEIKPVAAAASPVPAAATPETNPIATADSPVPAPTPEVLEDGWIRVPNRFSAEDIPPESYRLNDPGASDILYRYRMAPLPLDIKALAERFFGEDLGKLTLNASPDAFKKSTGKRTKGIARGDSDIYAVSDDFAYQLYRDVDRGAVRLLKPDGILEAPGGDFDGPVVDYSRSASDPDAGEAVGAALGFLKEACGMDTGLLTPVHIMEIPDHRGAQGYRIDFGYILDGRQLLNDPNGPEYIIIVYVVDGVVTDLDGNLFLVESRSPVSTGDMPMDGARVLEIATRGNHPPYGRPEICYCLDSSGDAGYSTRPIWVLPLLDLTVEARCFGYELRDGITGERLT